MMEHWHRDLKSDKILKPISVPLQLKLLDYVIMEK